MITHKTFEAVTHNVIVTIDKESVVAAIILENVLTGVKTVLSLGSGKVSILFSYHNSNVMREDFLYSARRLTIRLLEQGYVATRLKTSLQKFMVVIMNSWIVTVYPPVR